MTQYRALADFDLDMKKPSGLPIKKEYKKGQLVKIPEGYEEDPSYMARINSARKKPINALAFAVPYVEEYFDEKGEKKIEEFNRYLILPVAETQAKAGETEAD